MPLTKFDLSPDGPLSQLYQKLLWRERMKQGNLSKWVDIPNCENLLFFSQLVNELLFDYSIPSNRVSTLNSHYLCVDAINAISGIELHGVPEGTLKPIMEELYTALKKDVVFTLAAENPLNYFVKYDNSRYRRCNKVSELNYEELKKIAYAISTRYFSDNWYYESLKNNITNIVRNNQESDQQNLFRLTKSILTELINFGYSQKYIFFIMNRLFWNPREEISSSAYIDLFFKNFSLEKQEYTVVFVVNKAKVKALVKFVKDMPLVETVEQKIGSHIEKQFLRKRNDEAFLIFEEEAFDPFQAVEFERNMLEYIASFYKLCDHRFRYNIAEAKCGVYSKDEFFRIEHEVSAVSHTKMPSDRQIAESMDAAMDALKSVVSKKLYQDYSSLMNSSLFHAQALDSRFEKNQLLDFWAIFEAVLDISNKHTSDRILQVCSYLVPILKRKYIYSLFLQLANDIKNFSETDYKKIIGTASEEAEIVEKTCEFVLLDQKAIERTNFLSSCNEFPLLKERVEYYSHMLSTPASVYEFVEKHAERVRWQIMRIYRNRNLIVHNGDSMPYLGLLIENLHSYVDDFLSYSIHTISKGHDINSMCQELFSKECEWVAEFSGKKEPIDSDMISKMLAL